MVDRIVQWIELENGILSHIPYDMFSHPNALGYVSSHVHEAHLSSNISDDIYIRSAASSPLRSRPSDGVGSAEAAIVPRRKKKRL
jgi:hypothetical protein